MVAAVSPCPFSSNTLGQTLDNQEHEESTLVVNVCSSTTGARKRRRQILLSQRQGKNDLSKSLGEVTTQSSLGALAQTEKNREEASIASDASTTSTTATNSPKLDSVSSPREFDLHDDGLASPVVVQDTKNGKKPQMRYEPSVPMTKEQAAAWRREQRRKRNRESAAASRQRQRDRISELEQEIMEWKDKFQSAVDRLNKLEALLGQELTRYESSDDGTLHDLPKKRKIDMTVNETSKAVSPCPSPDLSPVSTPVMVPSCPTLASASSTFGVKDNVESEDALLCTPLEIVNEHSKEIQSLPAQSRFS